MFIITIRLELLSEMMYTYPSGRPSVAKFYNQSIDRKYEPRETCPIENVT